MKSPENPGRLRETGQFDFVTKSWKLCSTQNPSVRFSLHQALDVRYLGLGVGSLLGGSMAPQESEIVISNGRLLCGLPIGLPILLNVDFGLPNQIFGHNSTSLRYRGKELATLLEPEILERDARSHVF